MHNGIAYVRLVLFSLVAAVLLASCGGGGDTSQAPATNANNVWLINSDDVVDGGPGLDGIPSIDSPNYEPILNDLNVGDTDLVIAVLSGNQVKVYPHDIMNWHEIVNDVSNSATAPFVMSYCPLTGTALAWAADGNQANKTFGVSGLLFNSNLILYDRATKSYWSQMMEISVNGSRIREEANRTQVVETTMSTIVEMYSDAQIMTRNTGVSRAYDSYPYGSYREDADLLFPVDNTDNRLHPKARVLGVRQDGAATKVYQLQSFGPTTQAINDQVGSQSIVVVGNSARNFAVAFDRQLPDGTILTFAPLQESNTANVLQDDEGNTWNIWGTAVSGPRTGQQLDMTKSFIAFWFAWVAFYPGAEIHFN